MSRTTKLFLMAEHSMLVAKGNYETARVLLQFLAGNKRRFYLDDSDYECSVILENYGFKMVGLNRRTGSCEYVS